VIRPCRTPNRRYPNLNHLIPESSPNSKSWYNLIRFGARAFKIRFYAHRLAREDIRDRAVRRFLFAILYNDDRKEDIIQPQTHTHGTCEFHVVFSLLGIISSTVRIRFLIYTQQYAIISSTGICSLILYYCYLKKMFLILHSVRLQYTVMM